MATLGTGNLTIMDITKRMDPDGKAAMIAELLSQRNDVLLDLQWVEGNLPTGHRTTVRTGLPSVTWRLINQGVTPSKSTTAQIDEQVGILEAWSEVDEALAELNGNVGATRLSEGKAFLEAMNQEFTQTLFYGNSGTAPEEFTGLSTRYPSLTGNAGQNVVDGGGSGSDNSSMWLVCWSPETVHGIFPKGSQAGLTHEDMGLDTVEATAGLPGSRLLAYRERWQWRTGIALRDWRYAVRGANIDISALVAKSSAADLLDMLIRMYHRIPNLSMGQCAYYMNRTTFQMLDIQRRDDVAGGGMVYAEVDGKLIPSFRGFPIRISDQLTEAEAAVT